MSFLIREILATDAAAISQLSAQLGYDFSPEKTLLQIDTINASTDNVAYVASDKNKIIG